MYIPDFWCGVIATVLVELIVATVLIITATVGKGKHEDNNDQGNQSSKR